MTFNPSIPQATDRPSDSQSQILNNFTALNNIFNQEHVTFNAATDNGEHKKITMNAPLGADPNLSDPKASLYTKTVAGDSELFFEKFDNVATANLVRQLTNLTIVTAGGNFGVTTPWGIVINWGTVVLTTAGTAVTFAVAFPNAANSVVLTAQDANASRNGTYQNLITTGFTAHGTNNGLNASYLAIGN